MDSEQHGQDQREVPRVGAPTPPPPPALPPRPPAPPEATVHPLVTWLRMPRPEAGPGIWRAGHKPRAAEPPDQVAMRQLLVGAGVSALVGWLLWSLLWNGYLGSWWIWPLLLLTPNDKFQSMYFVVASWTYYALVTGGIAVFFGRLGGWPEVLRRTRAAVRQANENAVAAQGAPPPPPESDPALWPQVRADGAVAVADALSAELRDGRMTDVDYARIDHAWRNGRARAEITEEVRTRGAAACAHGSGARDLPARAAQHDLPLRQVRIGAAADSPRNPYVYREAGVALDPGVLGTSALVVGPSGREPAEGIVGPVIESLCLQALAGQAAVVAVTSSGSAAPQNRAFDVVLRAGDPSIAHGLDLYAGLDDADEAAAVLAEGLVGDLAEAGRDDRWAATALAQLLGPWRAVHDRYPGVDELRDLLDSEAARAALRAALDDRGATAHLRELDAFERRSAAPGGPAETLSTRLALLDRPTFHALLAAPELGSAAGDRAVFSMQHIDRPVRVRIDLPGRVHTDASRIIARLVLAQFTVWATSRRDQSVFAFLVLEDAVQTVTPNSLRGLQSLRRSNAGVLFSLRTLSDIPEGLRDHLLAAVGCRVACVGVSSWDAQHFATAWGTEWVETEAITHRQVRAEHPGTKVWHAVRKMVTGRDVTTKSVTMRREERQRWSSSQLANELQTGHAVISLTAVTGERMPPILTKLDG
ncbi:ATP-binding protein [Streptomyces sp. NPDC088744]|uniref:ATP-binding protein n=1 Tax=Streptomyces sp. NPDC088744 TaxID=3155061 RepID=UPI00344D78B1